MQSLTKAAVSVKRFPPRNSRDWSLQGPSLWAHPSLVHHLYSHRFHGLTARILAIPIGGPTTHPKMYGSLSPNRIEAAKRSLLPSDVPDDERTSNDDHGEDGRFLSPPRRPPPPTPRRCIGLPRRRSRTSSRVGAVTSACFLRDPIGWMLC